jgi:hypothetical protein
LAKPNREILGSAKKYNEENIFFQNVTRQCGVALTWKTAVELSAGIIGKSLKGNVVL